MDSLPAILRFGFSNQVSSSTPDRLRVWEAQQALLRMIRQLANEVEKINTDPELTPGGKAGRRAKAAARVMAELEASKSRALKGLQNRLAEIQTQVSQVTTKSGPDFGVSDAEVRDYVRGLSSSDRIKIFQEAIDRGDQRTFAAIANAPAAMGLLHPKLVEEGKRLWVEQKSPQLPREMKEVGELTEILAENYKDIAAGIGQMVQGQQ